MKRSSTPDRFASAQSLVWLQAQPSHCPICHNSLQGQDHSLELELPMQVMDGSIKLFHCLHCPAPVSGVLRDLERFLTSTDQAGVAHLVALFEIAGFCVDGCWLDVDVEMQADSQTVSWGVYAQRLEAQTELAESEAVRRRFVLKNLEVLLSVSDVPNRTLASLQLDAEDP
jgi:hypothetical protein